MSTKKILLSLSEDFIEKIDAICQEYNFERTEFIRQTLREKVYGYRVYKKEISKDIEKVVGTPDNVLGKALETATGRQIQNETPRNLGYPKVGEADETHDELGYLYAGNPIEFSKMRVIKHWCNLNVSHPFSAGVKMDTYCVTFENTDGTTRLRGKQLLQNVYGCRGCVESLASQYGDGSVLTGEVSEA